METTRKPYEKLVQKYVSVKIKLEVQNLNYIQLFVKFHYFVDFLNTSSS